MTEQAAKFFKRDERKKRIFMNMKETYKNRDEMDKIIIQPDVRERLGLKGDEGLSMYYRRNKHASGDKK